MCISSVKLSSTRICTLLKMVPLSLSAFTDTISPSCVGGKSFVLYIATTAIAIATAIVLGILIGPGKGFVMEGVDASLVKTADAPTVWQVFANIVPSNPVAALASGDMLQIIFYVIVVGVAALMLGERSTDFARACEYLNELAMKIVDIVMSFAPYGVFCLIA